MDLSTRRKELGLTQDQLCALVGISRQALSGIERGVAQPRVGLALKMAVELSSSVEELFGESASFATLRSNLGATEPQIYGELAKKMILRDLPSTATDANRQVPNALFDGKSQVLRLAEPAIVVDGCDPILGTLTGYLSRRLDADFGWWSLSNAVSLRNLCAGQSHLCLLHSPVGQMPEFPASLGATLIPLVRWDLCVATKANNPKAIRRPEDLFRGDVAFAQRISGSGVRQITDLWALELGIIPTSVVGFESHLDACNAVRFGNFDATATMAPVAGAVGLDFTPIAEQQSWLLVHPLALEMAKITDALHEILSKTTQRLFGAIPNYKSAS